MEAFASVGDLAARWAGYTPDMDGRAGAVLGDVSARIRALMARRAVVVDPDDEVQASVLRSVTCAAAARCLSAAAVADGAPVSQWTQTATPYSTSYIFSNPNGDIYLTKQELRALGLAGGRVRALSPFEGVGEGA